MWFGLAVVDDCVDVYSDVRRLVVAMSRARLGLYIFARVSLFSNCFELTPAFNRVGLKTPLGGWQLGHMQSLLNRSAKLL